MDGSVGKMTWLVSIVAYCKTVVKAWHGLAAGPRFREIYRFPKNLAGFRQF
jgi:hypothetical protein